jgi:23S rRNA (adenine2030-N6)-methyltransferase
LLSYQHAYHAGGPADLHKHIVLAELLDRLTRKPRGITYAETHAGRGLYDLASPEAAKTGEAAAGIARIAPDPSTPFGRALAAVRAAHRPAAYPGSPLLARTLLRPQDRLLLCELHPAEHAALRATLAGPGVAIHRRDGFESLLALAPPRPRRGLLLVDPSYEVKSDFEAAAGFVRRLVAKWPEAAVLVWYPILPAARHRALLAGLAPLCPLVDEASFAPPPARGMTGSGLALVNAPFGAGQAFAAARAQAAPVLAGSSGEPAKTRTNAEPNTR